MRGIHWAALVGVMALSGLYAFRPALGRSRPDLAAYLSFDDGPLTFSRVYESGKVGPFAIGESRSVTRQHLNTFRSLEQDKAQLKAAGPDWRIAVPARSGGYVIYTLAFDGDRLATVKAFYSLLAGL